MSLHTEAGTIDGVNWTEELEKAILLATEATEGLRPWTDLSDQLHAWWYATLGQRVCLRWPCVGPPEATYEQA